MDEIPLSESERAYEWLTETYAACGDDPSFRVFLVQVAGTLASLRFPILDKDPGGDFWQKSLSDATSRDLRSAVLIQLHTMRSYGWAVDLLASAARNESDETLRALALEGLGYIEGDVKQEILELLLQAARSDDLSCRKGASAALRLLSMESLIPPGDALSEEEKILRFGPSSHEPLSLQLEAALGDSNVDASRVRGLLGYYLHQDPEGAREWIRQAVLDSRLGDATRIAILERLPEAIRGADLWETLAPLVDSKGLNSPVGLVAAAHTWSESAADPAAARRVQALLESSRDERSRAVWLIASAGHDPESLPGHVQRLAASGSPLERSAALLVGFASGLPETQEALRIANHDSAPLVRRTAALLEEASRLYRSGPSAHGGPRGSIQQNARVREFLQGDRWYFARLLNLEASPENRTDPLVRCMVEVLDAIQERY